MPEKNTIKSSLLPWYIIPPLLMFIAVIVAIGFSIDLYPWLALPLFMAFFIWLLRSGQAFKQIHKYFKFKGGTIDNISSVPRDEQERLNVPKNSWIIRYHDEDAVEYRAIAVCLWGKVDVLRDVRREVYESEKPEWKEGDDIDLDIIREAAYPSAAQKYLYGILLHMFQNGIQHIILREEQGLPEIQDTPMPVSLASVIQKAQIAGHTAGSSGTGEFIAEGKDLSIDFFSSGQSGHQTLSLTLKLPDKK